MSERTRTHSKLDAEAIVRLAAETAVSKKAQDPVALDLRDLDGVCDFFFICTGTSEVQVKAIAEKRWKKRFARRA